MITLAIVAIIATIAYPTYLNQVRKARRVEGKSLLLEAQGKQERFFTENNSYALNMSALGYGANNVITEDGWYGVMQLQRAVRRVRPCHAADSR